MLNEKESKLAAYFLNQASELFANHGCNDVDDAVWDDWTLEERQQFVKEMNDYNNNSPDEFEPDIDSSDWVIMEFLAHKLESKESHGIIEEVTNAN